MFSWKEINQNYIFRYTDKIRKVTAPLRDHFGLTYFTYHQITNDGHYRVLVDRPDFAERYVSDQFYLNDPYLRHPVNFRSGLCLVGEHGEQQYVDRCFEVFDTVLDADMEALLIDKQAGGVEFFGFAGKTLTSALPNLYLNNPQLLVAFAKHFKEQMTPIITKMSEEPISLSDLKGADYYRQELVDPLVDVNAYHAFLKDIGMGDMVRKALLISPQERRCLELLLECKTARETAIELKLSPRTVESYFENIKCKLDCWTKQEVIAMAKTMQELRLL